MAIPFGKSPLFHVLPTEARNRLRKHFKQSIVGQLQREIDRLGTSALKNQIQQVVDRYSRQLTPQGMLRQLLGSGTYNMARDVERYARSHGLSKQLLGDILASLGPAGKLIQAVIAPQVGKNLLGRELSIAKSFLQAYGRLVVEPDDSKHAEQMAEYLRGMGYTVLPPGKRPRGTRPPAESVGEVQVERPAKTVKINGREFSNRHPLVSGDMVLSPNSSNVHSFGYDLESDSLYVRFLASAVHGAKAGPGPLYRYAGVTPEEFLSLYRTRNAGDGAGGDSTPGTWLWSHIRIRGTISGHRKDYELVGVMRNYVPRKATITPEGEAFIGRAVRTLGGKRLKSRKPNVLVRALAPIRTRRG